MQIDNGTLTNSKDRTDAIKQASRYMHLAGLTLQIGNHSLARVPLLDQHQNNDSIDPESEYGKLQRLLKLLIQIQQLSSEPDHPPWHKDSQFQKFQLEIDGHLIRHPEGFSLNGDALKTLSAGGFFETILSAFVWHCCVISLNRIFLPIPVLKRNLSAGESNQKYLLRYPSAPNTFLAEKINVCMASATTASILCQELLECGSVMLVSHCIISLISVCYLTTTAFIDGL